MDRNLSLLRRQAVPLLLLVATAAPALAQTGTPTVTFEPSAPTSADAVLAVACYAESTWHSSIVLRSGNAIQVDLTELNFESPGPRCERVVLGRLEPGRYQVTIRTLSGQSVVSVVTAALGVAPAPIPAGRWIAPGLLVLVLATAFIEPATIVN
jgi:hypothetical protein